MSSATETAILEKIRTLGISGIEAAPNISAAGLAGCRQYIAPSADPNTMLFVTNGGALGRGIPKTGVALNGEYLFFRNIKQDPVAVRLKDITSVEYHPYKPHKDSTYHNNDRVIIHCSGKAERHMEDCLIGCDCLGMVNLLQLIIEIKDQIEIQIQNLHFCEMPASTHVAYLKVLCNFCYVERSEIVPEALSAIHNIADRLNLPGDSRMDISDYALHMDQREITGQLISQAAQGMAAGGLNVLRAVLPFDMIYLYRVLHRRSEGWNNSQFLMGIAKTLRVPVQWLNWMNQLWDVFTERVYPFSGGQNKEESTLRKAAQMYAIPYDEFHLSTYKTQAVILRFESNLQLHLYDQNICLLEENMDVLPDAQQKLLKERTIQHRHGFLTELKSELYEKIDSNLICDLETLCDKTRDNEDYHILAYVYAQNGDRVRMEQVIDHLKSAFVTEFDMKEETDQLYKIVCCQMNRKMYRLYQLFLEKPKKALKEENGLKDCLGLDLLHYVLLSEDDGDLRMLLNSGKYVLDIDRTESNLLTYGCIAVAAQDADFARWLFLYTTSVGRSLLETEKAQERKENASDMITRFADSMLRSAMKYEKNNGGGEVDERIQKAKDGAETIKEFFSPSKNEFGEYERNSDITKKEIKSKSWEYYDYCVDIFNESQGSKDEYQAALLQIYSHNISISEISQLTLTNSVLRKSNDHIFVVPQ